VLKIVPWAISVVIQLSQTDSAPVNSAYPGAYSPLTEPV